MEATINGVRTKFNVVIASMGRIQDLDERKLGLILRSEDKQHQVSLEVKNPGYTGNQVEAKKYEVFQLPPDDPTTEINESLYYPRDATIGYSERTGDNHYLSEPHTTTGEIVITEIDPVNLTVSGTFTGELKVYESQKLRFTFTKGKFRNIQYKVY